MNNFEALQLSNEIQESIEIVGELWELSDFEVTAMWYRIRCICVSWYHNATNTRSKE